MANRAGRRLRTTRALHQTAARNGLARGRMARNFHSGRARRRRIAAASIVVCSRSIAHVSGPRGPPEARAEDSFPPGAPRMPPGGPTGSFSVARFGGSARSVAVGVCPGLPLATGERRDCFGDEPDVVAETLGHHVEVGSQALLGVLDLGPQPFLGGPQGLYRCQARQNLLDSIDPLLDTLGPLFPLCCRHPAMLRVPDVLDGSLPAFQNTPTIVALAGSEAIRARKTRGFVRAVDAHPASIREAVTPRAGCPARARRTSRGSSLPPSPCRRPRSMRRRPRPLQGWLP